MRWATAALAAGALLLAACSFEQPVNEELLRSDPERLLQQGVAAMQELRSYRMEMAFDGQPFVTVEFVPPGSYRSLTTLESGAVYESVIIGGAAYARECESEDGPCDDWREGVASPMSAFGPSPSFLPQWPLVALEMTTDAAAVGQEVLDGEPLLRVSGSANHLRAVLENQRRVFQATGITSFGEECFSGTDGQEECRELTYREALENQEPALSFYDQRPATIDAWISPDDFRVHRIQLDIPPHDDPTAVGRPSDEAVVTIEYSRFDEISIVEPY